MPSRWILIPIFLGFANFHLVLAVDTCKLCYYKDPGQPNAYQVNTCSACADGKEGKGKKEGPLPYPSHFKVRPCTHNATSAGTCADLCTLPGGPCTSDGDCCAYPYIPKIYPSGKYSRVDGEYRQLSVKSGTKCIFGTCRIDACKEGAPTCSKQLCYIQDPSVSQFTYLVYGLFTCGSCISRMTGARKVVSSYETGIISKDGLVLRDQGGKCAYCSVLHGKCVNSSDCCESGYPGYSSKVVIGGGLQAQQLYTFRVDRLKCFEGKCEFASCEKTGDYCIPASGKPCCDSKAKCTGAGSVKTCTTKVLPPPDCPKKSNLVTCPGYRGDAYCNCSTAASPEICLSNGQCKPCTLLGKACKASDECCKYSGVGAAGEHCIGSKCTRCFPYGRKDCHDYKCCSGTCKTFEAKGTFGAYTQCAT